MRSITPEVASRRRTATPGHLRQRERSHNGGSVSYEHIDHLINQKPVDPAAAAALRILHDELDLSFILARNTMPCEKRWPALQQAGIDGLLRVALLSYPLGVRKPEALFYELVLAAAGCPASRVLFVGDNFTCDVAGLVAHGMRAALVRPRELKSGEVLPDGALLIRHVQDLPVLLKETAEEKSTE